MLIEHKLRGLEILVFYREEVYEHPNAGFTYEGENKLPAAGCRLPVQARSSKAKAVKTAPGSKALRLPGSREKTKTVQICCEIELGMQPGEGESASL